MIYIAIKIYNLITRLYIKYIISYLRLYHKIFKYSDNKSVIFQGEISFNQQPYGCAFSHFDVDNMIDDYVLHYLKTLKEAGFAIVFVSTSRFIKEKYIKSIQPLVSQIILRKNVGSDIKSYAVGIEILIKQNHFSKILIANDSVYGPFFDLKDLLTTMDNKSLDIMGITDSWQNYYHIQSYFILFNTEVLKHTKVKEFWNNIAPTNNKHFIISEYEIGFSRMIAKLPFKYAAFCHYDDICLYYYNSSNNKINLTKNYNPTHEFWDVLITNFKCPFIKIELLRKNPSKVKNIIIWRKIITESSDYNIEPINRHLRRLYKDH